MKCWLPDATQARRQWLTSTPFPHLVITDAIYPDEAAQIGAEYPPPDDPRWKTYSGPLEQGKQEAPAEIAGPYTAAIHAYLAGDEFVGWLRTVAGLPGLIADPTRIGGGIHQAYGSDRTHAGSRLGMHVDFNVHPADPSLVRAVNVILFVGDPGDLWRYEADPDGAGGAAIFNRSGWRDSWGGTLRLGEDPFWAPTVYPIPGTLVVFEASDTSWHGHPDPMTADAPLRRSVPAYYYRPVGPDETVEAHSTRFLEVERGRCPHKLERPGETIVAVDGRCNLCGGELV